MRSRTLRHPPTPPPTHPNPFFLPSRKACFFLSFFLSVSPAAALALSSLHFLLESTLHVIPIPPLSQKRVGEFGVFSFSTSALTRFSILLPTWSLAAAAAAIMELKGSSSPMSLFTTTRQETPSSLSLSTEYKRKHCICCRWISAPWHLSLHTDLPEKKKKNIHEFISKYKFECFWSFFFFFPFLCCPPPRLPRDFTAQPARRWARRATLCRAVANFISKLSLSLSLRLLYTCDIYIYMDGQQRQLFKLQRGGDFLLLLRRRQRVKLPLNLVFSLSLSLSLLCVIPKAQLVLLYSAYLTGETTRALK